MGLPALELIAEFRVEAERRASDPEKAGVAFVWLEAANRLERSLREDLNRVVTISEAARLPRTPSESTLRQMAQDGRMRVVGRHPWRVRVGDLPMKPVAPDTDVIKISRTQAVRVAQGETDGQA